MDHATVWQCLLSAHRGAASQDSADLAQEALARADRSIRGYDPAKLALTGEHSVDSEPRLATYAG